MAAILFTDVVGYSKMSEDEQRQSAQGLNEVCTKSLLPAFRYQRTHPGDKTFVAAMPTGDGIVVCLEAVPDLIPRPHLYLLKLGFYLQRWARSAGVQLRTGLHDGALLQIEDVNLLRNFCGHELNMAQRIMDIGQGDHVLCSAIAYKKYLRNSPPKWLVFTELAAEYRVKHGEAVALYNVTTKGRYKPDLGNPDPPPVIWKYEMLPFSRANSISPFQGSKRLIVVGVTNDKISETLSAALRPNPPTELKGLDELTELDVYYAKNGLFKYMPRREHGKDLPGAVPGNKDRSPPKLAKEKRGSIKTFKKLASTRGAPKIRLFDCRLAPIAGIVARDLDDNETGLIRITHYIWGTTSGSSPTLVLRPRSLPEVYKLYKDYILSLEAESVRIS